MNTPTLILGTSSWSESDWVGPFYPPGTKPAQYIEHYSRVFKAVEVDATYYRMPTPKTVEAWRNRTPEGFLFALKTPGIITHEKILKDADDDMSHFVEVIRGLQSRLGPVLLQFPYFNKSVFPGPEPFLERLDQFLGKLPADIRFAVEVRNRWWVKKPLQKICASHNVALAWVSQGWMPEDQEWISLTGGPSTDFAYIRFLGDRKEIEAITTTWGKSVIDRTPILEKWVPVVKDLFARDVKVFGFFNNHFDGYAPNALAKFQELINKTP